MDQGLIRSLPEQIIALGVAAEVRKGGLHVLLSGRFHLSQFSDGRPIDIRLHRMVLALDYHFFRSIPSPRSEERRVGKECSR